MGEQVSFASTGVLALVAAVVLVPIAIVQVLGAGLTEGLLVALVVVPILLAALWVYVDARRRADDHAWLWTIVTLALPLVGLIVYLGVRAIDTR
ncbi:hypothetical protein BRD56_11735 [Thermoplasmatales archaeon SW_10_69_26]|jgi:predicted ABC-type sugar transport system permease subunit|nr:MAG: hypothetical protein BRD56_11735 [Thermoplasmatales archaeon SW_10_69_26]